MSISVRLLIGNNPAHTPFRGRDVTDIARNQVYMNVKDALTGSLTDIDADVITVGVETLIDQIFHTV